MLEPASAAYHRPDTADMTTSAGSSLPPMQQNFPQWSRVTSLDKARYPRPFLKDRLQVLPPPPPGSTKKAAFPGDEAAELYFQTTSEAAAYMADPDSGGSMDSVQRIGYLERNLEFVKRHHAEVLRSLHEEIDLLKRENKDLHFKLVMARGGIVPSKEPSDASDKSPAREASGGATAAGGSRRISEDSNSSKAQKLGELKAVFLEEEVKELKYALQEERNKNAYLQQIIEGAIRNRPANEAADQQTPSAPSSDHSLPGSSPVNQPAVAAAPQRPPTLEECEVIIRHLQRANDAQSHELQSLKADLKDVLFSDKWTPEAYLLAKAYVNTQDKGLVKSITGTNNKLPKLVARQQPLPPAPPAQLQQLHQLNRKLPEVSALVGREQIIQLPALKQTMGNRMAERKKRVDAMKKQKLRKDVLL